MKLVEEVKKILNEAATEEIFYAILIVQNAYASGNRGKEYGWVSNYQDEPTTRADFAKLAKRAAARLQEKYFVDTVRNGGQTKVYTDRDKFIADFKKLTGNSPKFNE